LAVFEFREMLEKYASELNIKPELLSRSLNDGFSGGEKKRIEILQLRTLRPNYVICDETDSGLDVDALKIVALGIKAAVKETKMGCLVITHYQRILRFLRPDKVHIMVGGKIVRSGENELVKQIEKEGYKSFKSETEKDV
jgi:Fe-S cluster assembly ATP-binding protein